LRVFIVKNKEGYGRLRFILALFLASTGHQSFPFYSICGAVTLRILFSCTISHHSCESILFWRRTTVYCSHLSPLLPTMATDQPHTLVKEEDTDHAETNREFRHSLLQRWHRSCRASRATLNTGGFKQVNFFEDCLSHLQSFYLLRLL